MWCGVGGPGAIAGRAPDPWLKACSGLSNVWIIWVVLVPNVVITHVVSVPRFTVPWSFPWFVMSNDMLLYCSPWLGGVSNSWDWSSAVQWVDWVRSIVPSLWHPSMVGIIVTMVIDHLVLLVPEILELVVTVIKS